MSGAHSLAVAEEGPHLQLPALTVQATVPACTHRPELASNTTSSKRSASTSDPQRMPTRLGVQFKPRPYSLSIFTVHRRRLHTSPDKVHGSVHVSIAAPQAAHTVNFTWSTTQQRRIRCAVQGCSKEAAPGLTAATDAACVGSCSSCYATAHNGLEPLLTQVRHACAQLTAHWPS